MKALRQTGRTIAQVLLKTQRSLVPTQSLLVQADETSRLTDEVLLKRSHLKLRRGIGITPNGVRLGQGGGEPCYSTLSIACSRTTHCLLESSPFVEMMQKSLSR